MAEAVPVIKLGHYQVNLLDKLGQGVFGIVFRGKETRRGIKVAIKQVELKKDDKAGADKVGSDAMTEIKNLQKLPSHPYIVKLFDFHFHSNSFWMIMEFCNLGNLSEYFENYRPIEFLTKLEFMQQTVSAIAHLHGLPVPIVHRDVKPANIMLHYTGDRPVIKVTDFGLAKVAEDKADMAKTFMMSTMGGTPAFMAPEFFLREKYTSSVDVFALGLVFVGMLNYEATGEILPSTGTPLGMLMPLGMMMAQALKTGSSPPKVVELKSSDSKDMKDVKQVIQKMVMPKKEDRMKVKDVSTAFDNMFAKVKDRLPPPPPRLSDTENEAAGDLEGAEGDSDSEAGDIGYNLLRQAAGQLLEEKGGPGGEDNARNALLGPGGGRMPLLEMLLLQALGEKEDDESLPGGLKKGDKVLVESDIERAKLLQENYGGWNDSMRQGGTVGLILYESLASFFCFHDGIGIAHAQYLGKQGEVQGKVLHVIKVKFPDGVSWSYNPSLLEKVNPDGSTTPVVDSRKSRMEEVVRGLFHRFDVVQIPKEQSVVELLQKGHGGWNDRMKLCLGIKGMVNKVDKDGDVFVECINGDDWTFNPELLIKVEPDPNAQKEAGDFVLVMGDVERVKQLQVNHGGWAKDMEKCCGHTGIIKAVLPKDRLKVEVAHNTWIFNKNAITLVAKGEEMLEAILRRKLKL